MNKTTIEWADATWNPVRGCKKVSPGCLNCYAERFANRFKAKGQPFYGFVDGCGWTSHSAIVYPILNEPLRWRALKPGQRKRVFVGSMTDIFQESLAVQDIELVWRMILAAAEKGYTMIVLTKRAERMAKLVPELMDHIYGRWLKVPERIWLGASVENQDAVDDRAYHVMKIPAEVRFLSYEPALSEIDISKYLQRPVNHFSRSRRNGRFGINWVIAGGETGHGAREPDPQWFRYVLYQCRQADVPFFFKQWGTWCPESQIPMKIYGKKAGHLLDGREWREFPL